ncbi:MAG: bifunctional glutamate N-acetyltransferase/amino-acid acetyltransferase ArgJ [Candidatus Glassbacteria bacterium]|nr:bifunctional glutamate N-acetyltransferase/amino-acid acetyltransferase ArgJ [Candidatus Glassbacteria bacterium]
MNLEIDQSGSVDSVPAFRASGTACGIKAGNLPDLGVILADRPCAAAGVFTTNRLQAAPVLYCREVLAAEAENIRAVVVNSGNANACTGSRGMDNARRTAQLAEQTFAIEPSRALVMSTGIIGEQLPMDKLASGLQELGSTIDSGAEESFAAAIMTTDTVAKHLSLAFQLEDFPVTIGGAAKGSGMIHPDMATMLAFFTTDAAISPPALAEALRRVTGRSFNMISVDGDRSPNDSVFVLANGASGAAKIEDEDSPGFELFCTAFERIAVLLAKKIAADGEGATKLVEISVSGAASFEDAARVARAVANSPLVKTALYGQDPNWGRIVSAVGYSGVEVNPERLTVRFDGLAAFSAGEPSDTPDADLAAKLAGDEVLIEIELGMGGECCRFWTCDMTCNYIRINADYHT